jgi:hypothetical protein
MMIRSLIGDVRADELGHAAFTIMRQHNLDSDELVYLSECLAYLAWCKAQRKASSY